MANQFTIYTSADIDGPGAVNSLTGSLIKILDACLVDGYGTGSYFKSGSGWIKPFANSGSADGRPVFGAWTQKSGSGFTLFINDAGAGTGLGSEAWATGWENLTSIAPTGSAASNVGIGSGQFPLPSQLLTNGHVNWRKSLGGTLFGRPWLIVADAATMYMWVQPGDFTNKYNHFGFGDFYSLAGSNDRWRCFIYGKPTDNSTNIVNNTDYCDQLAMGPWSGNSNSLLTAQSGHFIARSAGGTGQSVPFSKKGDYTVAGSVSLGGTVGVPITGILPCPAIDNSIYMSPLFLVEVAPVIRGKLKGLYHVGHASSNFYDGQLISGSGDFAGRVFMIVKETTYTAFWAIEVSPTLDIN